MLKLENSTNDESSDDQFRARDALLVLFRRREFQQIISPIIRHVPWAGRLYSGCFSRRRPSSAFSLHAQKNDTRNRGHPPGSIVMVTVIAFADPSSRDEVLFHFIPLRAALSAFARVIGNISSKGREHFLPLLHFPHLPPPAALPMS